MNDKFKELLKTAIAQYPTQKDFAEASGISSEHLSRMLSDAYKSKPNAATLYRIAEASKGVVPLTSLLMSCDYEDANNMASVLSYANSFQMTKRRNEESHSLRPALRKQCMLSCRKLIFHSLYDFALSVVSAVSSELDFKIGIEEKCRIKEKEYAEFCSAISFYDKVEDTGILQVDIYYCKTQRGNIVITDVEFI